MVNGLTLDQWLATSFAYEDGVYRGAITPEFNHALQQFGTNAIPRLLSKLKARPLPVPTAVNKLVLRSQNPQALNHALGLDRWFIQRQRALQGFRALGSLGTNALHEILAMEQSLFTADAIAAMEYSALPTLRDAVRNGADQIKSNAMFALESTEFDFKREEMVELWIERLGDPSPSIRLHAARLLGRARPIRAQAAIEPLQKAINDPDAEVAAAVQTALGKLKTPL